MNIQNLHLIIIQLKSLMFLEKENSAKLKEWKMLCTWLSIQSAQASWSSNIDKAYHFFLKNNFSLIRMVRSKPFKKK